MFSPYTSVFDSCPYVYIPPEGFLSTSCIISPCFLYAQDGETPVLQAASNEHTSVIDLLVELVSLFTDRCQQHKCIRWSHCVSVFGRLVRTCPYHTGKYIFLLSTSCSLLRTPTQSCTLYPISLCFICTGWQDSWSQAALNQHTSLMDLLVEEVSMFPDGRRQCTVSTIDVLIHAPLWLVELMHIPTPLKFVLLLVYFYSNTIMHIVPILYVQDGKTPVCYKQHLTGTLPWWTFSWKNYQCSLTDVDNVSAFDVLNVAMHLCVWFLPLSHQKVSCLFSVYFLYCLTVFPICTGWRDTCVTSSAQRTHLCDRPSGELVSLFTDRCQQCAGSAFDVLIHAPHGW